MDQSSEEPDQLQGDVSINRHTARRSHLTMDDACIMEMTSSTLWKKCGVSEKTPKRDITSHSLDSLARTSTPRAEPNEYEMFYQAPLIRSQPSSSDTLADEIKNKTDHRTEQRRTEMTDSDGLCTSDSFTASSEFSESKYDESSISRPTSRLAQRHLEMKEQYLIEQQRKRLHEQYPQVSSSNTNEYSMIPSSCYDPEKSSMFKASSHYGSCRKYEDYLEESRGMRWVDSRNPSSYESWEEDTASKRRSRDGTLPSADRSQIWEQQQKSPQNGNYRHKNRRSTPSPNSGCWSSNTSLSYGRHPPPQSLGSSTTLTSYVDEYPHPRQHHRDPNRPHRKHKSRSSSGDDMSSVVGAHKKRSSEQQSISSRLESDRYPRRSEHKSRHDRSLDSKSIGKLSARSGQLQNEQSSTMSSHLATIDDIDFASLYGVNTRKLMGPLLLGLLVLIMLLSLGLAIYFALEFSTANIRLRIINSTSGEDLNYLSKPRFERLSSEYCRQMDRYYLQSALKKRYRGCDVISLKRQFINFTLYFTEKDISDKQVESVIETSVEFVDNPTGTRTAIIDKFIIEFSGIKVVISQKKEKLDFDKTRLELKPEVDQPSPTLKTPGTKSVSPPRSKNEIINMNKNAKDADHKFVTNNVDVHTEEKHRINEVPKKILTTSTPRRKLTLATIPTKRKSPPPAKTATTIKSTIIINKQINDNRGNTTHVSANPVENKEKEEEASVDSTDKTATHSKINEGIPLTDPCVTRKTGELIPHPLSCEKFYQCVHGTGIIQSCQKGTWFDPKLHVCGLRPKGVECTLGHKLGNSTSGSTTTRIPTTVKTTAMRTSSSTNEANTPVLSAANISPADTVIKLNELSASKEGERPRNNSSNNTGPQLKHNSWKSTTLDPLEGLIQEPCTTSLTDQYHPHPNGCNQFTHCVNGRPEEKSCPSDFVFDFKSASCIRHTPEFICPNFFPCRRNGTGNYFPHPYHCHLYIQCEFGKEKIMECASDLVFDPIVKTCTARLGTKDGKCPEERQGKKK